MSVEEKIAELHANGFCVLKKHFAKPLVESCGEAFWPILLNHLKEHGQEPNRGPNRYFLPMPFEPPCFAPEFFFDATVLNIVQAAMDNRIVADQWGCDVPVKGSQHQGIHADYQRPLFREVPDLLLPPYMLVISFGLIYIDFMNGPI